MQNHLLYDVLEILLVSFAPAIQLKERNITVSLSETFLPHQYHVSSGLKMFYSATSRNENFKSVIVNKKISAYAVSKSVP